SPWQGRGCPDGARLFVPQIDHLAWGVGYRVVRPGGEAVHLTITRPGVAQAGLCHQTPEAGVGQHIGPGRRWQGPTAAGGAVNGDHVLAAVRRESSMAVPEPESLGRRCGLSRRLCRNRGTGNRRPREGYRNWSAVKLICQGAVSATEDGPRGGGEQYPII